MVRDQEPARSASPPVTSCSAASSRDTGDVVSLLSGGCKGSGPEPLLPCQPFQCTKRSPPPACARHPRVVVHAGCSTPAATSPIKVASRSSGELQPLRRPGSQRPIRMRQAIGTSAHVPSGAVGERHQLHPPGFRSKKASSRVTAATWEATAAAGAAGRRAQRQAIGQASVEKTARRQFQKTGGQAIQAHIGARGRRQQTRRDAR